MSYSTYESFKKYQVEADNIEDFLNRFYKPDRYTGRGEVYTDTLLRSRQLDVQADGFTWISRHDSITGRCVSYYENRKENENDSS